MKKYSWTYVDACAMGNSRTGTATVTQSAQTIEISEAEAGMRRYRLYKRASTQGTNLTQGTPSTTNNYIVYNRIC